jgi:hypothetical protein
MLGQKPHILNNLKACSHENSIQVEKNMESVTTLPLEEWEDDTHTPEMGTCESTGTLRTSEFD